MRSIVVCAVMNATTLISVPHLRHKSGSTSNFFRIGLDSRCDEGREPRVAPGERPVAEFLRQPLRAHDRREQEPAKDLLEDPRGRERDRVDRAAQRKEPFRHDHADVRVEVRVRPEEFFGRGSTDIGALEYLTSVEGLGR